jgi:hypothetical protein
MPARSNVTAEQVAQITKLRNETKPNGRPLYTYKQIGEMVGGLDKGQVEYYFKRPEPKEPIEVVWLDQEDLPLKMRNGGEMCIQPVQPPLGRYTRGNSRQSSCDFCPLRAECDRAIARWRSDFIGCEAPTKREMVKD